MTGILVEGARACGNRNEVSPPILRVHELSKRFASGPPWRRKVVPVLDAVDVTLSAGEVLALLGPNGSGKTTLLKVLASLVTPDAGGIDVAGHEARNHPAARQLVGLASGEERSLFFRLTGRQNLRFFATLHGLAAKERERRIGECASTFDLEPFLDRRVDRCSSGMRARIGLARALLHSPKLLLLDEPTKSLDPAHATSARRLVKDWAAAGNAVIIATHLTTEAEEVATQIALLDGGKLSLHAPGSDWKRRVTAAA